MSFLGALVYSTIIVLNWYEEGRSVAINAWLVAMVSLMYLVYGWVVRPVFLTDEFTLLGMQLICFLWTCGASCVLAQGPDNVLYRNCNGVICTTIEDV